MPIVSNSSPLIALAQIERLDLLHALFGEIFIPDAVAIEIAPTVQTRSWIRQRILDDEPARKVAAELKIPIIGTGGVLVLAKDRQLIATVKPCLDALISHRFF